MRQAILCVAFGAFVMTSGVMAAIPQFINYQGLLTDDAGMPLDTTVLMTFTIYDDSTGGVAHWSETKPAVATVDGLFSVTLGPIGDVVFDAPDRYLGVKVGDDPELTPRTRLVSVGYAYRAAHADEAGGWVDDGAIVRLETMSDKVGIGTDIAVAPLHVAGATSGANPIVCVEQFGEGRGVHVFAPNGACGLVSEAGNHGLRVVEAGRPENPMADGVHIMHAWHDGVRVVSVDNDGVHVENAGGWAGYFDGSGYFRGHVGIGAETPSAQLHVSGTSVPPDPLVRIEQIGEGRGLYVNTSSGFCGLVSESGNHGLRVVDAGTHTLTGDGIHVMHAWRDGVHVVDADRDGIHVENAGGWAGYFVGSGYFSSQIGIGEDAPAEALDVAGNIRMSLTADAVVPVQKIYVEKATGENEDGWDLEIYAGEHSDLGPAETIYGGDLVLHGGRGYGLAGGKVYIYGGDNSSIPGPYGDIIMAHDGSLSGGNVGIRTDHPAYELDVDGDIQCVQLHETSDERLKTDVAQLANALAKIQAIRGVSFEWNQDAELVGACAGERQIGVLAQDVEKVFPELVSSPEGGYKSVDYSKLSAVLIEAVKELKSENDELRRRIERLESR